jgi:DNA-binding Lrp family transcriptional regulator
VLDELDRDILISLLRDGRSSLRRIGRDTDRAPAHISYRFSRLYREGILRGFTIYINPEIYGLKRALIGFEGLREPPGDYRFNFKCLEHLDVYEIIAEDLEALRSKINRLLDKTGGSLFVYLPQQYERIRLSRTSLEILEALKKNPRESIIELARKLGINQRTIKRHLIYMKRKGVFTVIPVIDLNRSGIVLTVYFSKNKAWDLARQLVDCMIWDAITLPITRSLMKYSQKSPADGDGIIICASKSLEEAKKYTLVAKAIDRDCWPMIIYEYLIKG